MAASLIVLSILIQFIAAYLAFRLVIQARRLALLPLAIAILLMGVRRAYSFYNSVAFERSFDVGAETIALTISLLMLVGLIGLQRWQRSGMLLEESVEIQDAPRRRISLANVALLLGVVVVAIASVVGAVAYGSSRSALLDSIFKRNLILAKWVGAEAVAAENTTSVAAWNEIADELWDRVGVQFEGSYLCIMDSNGLLLAHTRDAEAVGYNVGNYRIDLSRTGQPVTFLQLAASQEEWVGYFTARDGQKQVLAVSHIPGHDMLALVHTPASEIDAEIRASILPWAVGLAFTIYLLLPISLAMLYWAYSVSMNELGRGKSRLRRTLEFERKLRNELDHRVRNNLSSLIALMDAGRTRSSSADHLLASTRDRIGALAVVHSALSKGKWHGVALDALIRQVVGPDRSDRVDLDGPDVQLPISQTQAMGMVINELSMNSGKYGALGVAGGRVSVTWRVELEDDEVTNLTLVWEETAGPAVDPQSQLGAGLELVKGFVEHELCGTVDFAFPVTGVKHRFSIKLAATSTAQFDPVA